MIVCSCNVLSDKSIRALIGPGPDCPYTPAQVYRCLGCSPQCGRCARTIRRIMNQALTGVHETCQAACCEACPKSVAIVEGADLSAVDGAPIAVTADAI